MIKKYLNKFRGEFPKIIECVEKNITVRDALMYFFEKGIGQIHQWNDIATNLEYNHDEEQINNAIVELIKVDFLTRTGYHKDVLYVNKPTLAHFLGVILSEPKKYNAPKKIREYSKQLNLPFFLE